MPDYAPPEDLIDLKTRWYAAQALADRIAAEEPAGDEEITIRPRTAAEEPRSIRLFSDEQNARLNRARVIPMCMPCQNAAVAVMRMRQGFVSAADFGATGDGVTDDAPALQAAINAIESAQVNWGQPLEDSDANWPADNSNVCAHVCGGDHQCDVRATAQLTYELPSGGLRTMPLCQTCHAAECAAAVVARGGQ